MRNKQKKIPLSFQTGNRSARFTWRLLFIPNERQCSFFSSIFSKFFSVVTLAVGIADLFRTHQLKMVPAKAGSAAHFVFHNICDETVLISNFMADADDPTLI